MTRSHLDDQLWILWALAQRVSVDEKINACIECVNFHCERVLGHIDTMLTLFRVGRRSASTREATNKRPRLKSLARVLERIGLKSSFSRKESREMFGQDPR